MPLSNFFVSKHRKVAFEINFIIQDITNVPLVSGSYFVKWKLQKASQSTGITTKEHIKEHCVVWSFPVTTTAELVISKQHLLTPCELKLEIFQQVGGSNAKQMGSLSINLSEYATSGFITKRYLLEECKFNSFIKLSIEMKQITNVDEPFSVPPLTKPPRQTDISVMISNTASEKKEDSSIAHSISGSTSERSMQHHSNGILKSQSTLSLPQFCRNKPFFTDDPSPQDLVEQLFTPKSDLETTSC
ncbi:N-terminal C2 in EEIG1 and EHBP1 proteins-domain-containing protein [Halteromyces radiatus]|uniref:N-terminal C2 in EEIG1 and EHBP1 proteins-domain-containing protein n=1 Tax=Halteromyces radiatus TaxID=101107 RepID=UPI0022210605|nr:N-terminal C2 in EEIG1 and EHBP1 proteins-domain-containing protein [Halteromyces radiatus]KAI8076737.1 N-terminal C2 in EEIG1 and EHBP1 proteins-domain-containing protein [Halteromyces radiatus]